jgi:hypothetical protein
MLGWGEGGAVTKPFRFPSTTSLRTTEFSEYNSSCGTLTAWHNIQTYDLIGLPDNRRLRRHLKKWSACHIPSVIVIFVVLVCKFLFPKAARGFEPISYRGALVSTFLHATVYVFLHNLLNVLVQIANKMGFKKKTFCIGWGISINSKNSDALYDIDRYSA